MSLTSTRSSLQQPVHAATTCRRSAGRRWRRPSRRLRPSAGAAIGGPARLRRRLASPRRLPPSAVPRSHRAARRRPCRAPRRFRSPVRSRAGRSPAPARARLSSVLLIARITAVRSSRSSRAICLVAGHQPLASVDEEDDRDRHRQSRAGPGWTTSSCSGSSLAPYSPPVSNSSNAVAAPDRPAARASRASSRRSARRWRGASRSFG